MQRDFSVGPVGEVGTRSAVVEIVMQLSFGPLNHFLIQGDG